MGADPFTTPPVRYIGYSFAMWEAMKAVLRTKPEKTFYAVGAIFILVHALNQAVETHGASRVFFAFLDVLIFEALASVVVPVCIARGVFEVSLHLLTDLNIHYHVTKYGPTFLALVAILVASGPLDEFTDKVMDKTIRTLY